MFLDYLWEVQDKTFQYARGITMFHHLPRTYLIILLTKNTSLHKNNELSSSPDSTPMKIDVYDNLTQLLAKIIYLGRHKNDSKTIVQYLPANTR